MEEDEEVRPWREFFHSWYRDRHRPDLHARCVVTAVRDGKVFYRTYINAGERGRPDAWRDLRRFREIVAYWAEA